MRSKKISPSRYTQTHCLELVSKWLNSVSIADPPMRPLTKPIDHALLFPALLQMSWFGGDRLERGRISRERAASVQTRGLTAFHAPSADDIWHRCLCPHQGQSCDRSRRRMPQVLALWESKAPRRGLGNIPEATAATL